MMKSIVFITTRFYFATSFKGHCQGRSKV